VTVLPILKPGRDMKVLYPEGVKYHSPGQAALGWDGDNNPNPEGVA
jgi:hypothetical protein